MAIATHARKLFGRFSRLCNSSSHTSHCGVRSFQPERSEMTASKDFDLNDREYLSRFTSALSATPLSEKDLQEFEALLASTIPAGHAAYYRAYPSSLTDDAFLKVCIVPMLIAEVRRLRAAPEPKTSEQQGTTQPDAWQAGFRAGVKAMRDKAAECCEAHANAYTGACNTTPRLAATNCGTLIRDYLDAPAVPGREVSHA